MLPAAHRLTRAADFALVTKRGRRARAGTVVLHLLTQPVGGASRVGLVVGKAVGTSVVRHRVSRRLRAQLAQRLDRLPDGSTLVVRALPETATAPSTALGHDLDRALAKLCRAGSHPVGVPDRDRETASRAAGPIQSGAAR